MHTQTIDTLLRAHRQIMRCEEHLAEIHGRLQATSFALAKSLQILEDAERQISLAGATGDQPGQEMDGAKLQPPRQMVISGPSGP